MADLSTWQIVFVTLLVVFVMVGAVLSIIALLLRRWMQAASAQWAAAGIELVKGPELGNYRGHVQTAIPVRGNGVLGLTGSDMRFIRFVPRREFIVPLEQITRVEVRRIWHGQYRAGRPVIVVYYGADAIGVEVRDTTGWAVAIAAAAGVPVERPG